MDDFGSHNEVVHPELLAKLAEEFAKYKYDPKKLLEWICTSDAYQLSHVAQKEYADPKYDPYFARMPLKAMSPEVLFESLMTATKAESAGRAEGREATPRAVDGEAGPQLRRRRGERDDVQRHDHPGAVDDERPGAERGDRAAGVERGPRRWSRSTPAAESVNADRVLDELFLMTLNRHPTGEERAKLKAIQQRGAVFKAEAPKPEPPRAEGDAAEGPAQAADPAADAGGGACRPAPPT